MAQGATIIKNNLTQIGGSVITIGQAAMAASLPVVLASNQASIPVAATLQSNTGVDIGKLTANQSINVSQIAGGTAINSGVTGAQAVGGDTASAATDVGNPVKVAAVYNSTLPTFTTGQRGDLQTSTRGSLHVSLFQNDSTAAISARADNADGVANSSNTVNLAVINRNTLANGSNWDRQYAIINATNSVGTGITAVGLLAQFDDVSPTSITENQFGNLRMSANRNAYTTIRDAAGNERGTNVDASNNLMVAIGGGLFPTGTALNTTQNRITTNTTTTPTSSTAYISSIVITSEVAGTTSTITIQDKQATPRVLVDGLVTTAINTTPTILNFQTPIKMTSGIDIVTAGAVAATVDVWVNYFQ